MAIGKKIEILDNLPVGFISEIDGDGITKMKAPIGWEFCNGEKIKNKKSKLYGLNTPLLSQVHIIKVL